MWKSSAGERILRLLNKGERNLDQKETPTNTARIPDLLADNGHLSSIRMVRSYVRHLLRESREYDRKAEDLDNAYYQDMRRFIVFLCGRVIGGQKRDLTEKGASGWSVTSIPADGSQGQA